MIDPSITARCEAAHSHLAAGRFSQADRLFRAVLAEHPTYAPAVQGLGDAAVLVEDFSAAAEFYRYALRLDPKLVRSKVSLGIVIRSQGRWREAHAFFEQAAAEDPDSAPARYWLAFGQIEMGQSDAARENLDAALRLEPALIDPLSLSLYAFLEGCDWTNLECIVEIMEGAAAGPRALLSPMNLMLLTPSIQVIAEATRTYAKTYFKPPKPLCDKPNPRGPKIRIAYLSSDFHEHPVAALLVGVLEAHDREAFELIAISICPRLESPLRSRLESAFDQFFNVGEQSEEDIARLIRDQKIDIAVSLNGYTGDARPTVLAHRPAPVQVNYHGYPGTMGAPYIDYIIADRFVIPKDQTAFYDEKVVWMPHSYQPTDDKAPISEATPTRESQGLPAGAFVFMGYNRMHKVSPLIFDVWMKILKRVPGSVLWLQDGGEVARANLRREAQGRGVSADRLVFAKRVDTRADHLARQRLADLFLDTLPYNAHATASDALYAGLPVVTCLGSTFPGRVCAGLVTAAGFPELVTETLTDFENLAVALANDPVRVANLRARVQAQAPTSPLFQTANYTRHLEQAFRAMYETSQAGGVPQDFIIEAV